MLEVSFNRCPYDAQMTDYPCRFVCIKFFVYLYFGCFMLIIKNSFRNTNQICNLRNNFIGAVFVGDSIICELNKNEDVALSVLLRICDYLNCDIGDICEAVRTGKK